MSAAVSLQFFSSRLFFYLLPALKSGFQGISMEHPLVSMVNGTPTTSSQLVAETFGKRHDNVLRDIAKLCEQLPEKFRLLNFEEANYLNSQGISRPMYLLTRDAFTLLAMGYTGKEAMAFKVKYIEAFNAMEEELKKQEAPKKKAAPRRKLAQVGIPCGDHRARRVTWQDYSKFDRIIGMDEANRRNLLRMLKNDPDGKVSLLLDHTGHSRPIADPWYTGNFDDTYRDVLEGCQKILEELA